MTSWTTDADAPPPRPPPPTTPHTVRQAGNVACRVLPYGGLFLTGGVTAKLEAFIREPTRLRRLLARYLHTGARGSVLSDVISPVPLYLVRDEGLGVKGARIQAQRMLQGASGCCRRPGHWP